MLLAQSSGSAILTTVQEDVKFLYSAFLWNDSYYITYRIDSVPSKQQTTEGDGCQ